VLQGFALAGRIQNMYSLIYGQKEKLACATAGRWSSVIKFVQCACFSQLCFPKKQLKHSFSDFCKKRRKFYDIANLVLVVKGLEVLLRKNIATCFYLENNN